MTRTPISWQPLTQWPATVPRTPAWDQIDAPFRASGGMVPAAGGGAVYKKGERTSLPRTLADLDRELTMLDAWNVVVQVDVTPERRNFRTDGGGPLTDARVVTSAVVLTFERKKATHTFPCDRFNRWVDNLRGIALGLEGLRRLERYGIVHGGEQYRGWLALPAVTQPTLSTEQAAAVIARHAMHRDPALVLIDPEFARTSIRIARQATHPDGGGERAEWDLVQEARRILQAHHGVDL